jgi:hypothetical protein
MILHVAGTMVPGSPSLPEYMKASIYLPPSLVNNHPELRPSILQITQEFLETIGVTTVQNWRVRAKNDLGYSLTMPNVARANNTIYDLPQPQIRSSHYIIPGQPMGAGPTAPETASEVSSPTPSPPSSPFEDTEMLSQSVQLIDTQEQVHILSEQLALAQQEIQRLEALLEWYSDLDDDRPCVPASTRNTPVIISRSADSRTSSHQRHTYPEQSQSPSRSRFHTSRKGRVADIGLSNSPLRSTPVRPLQFTVPESIPSTQEKGKERQQTLDTSEEQSSFLFTELLLQNYGLRSALDQVLLIIKLIPETQWSNKLLRLGIPRGVVSEVLTAIAMDEAQMN